MGADQRLASERPVPPIFDWNPGNLGKIAGHGLTAAEVDEVFDDPHGEDDVSRSSGRPLRKGYTAASRYLVVVYEEQDDNPRRLYVVTAYAPGE